MIAICLLMLVSASGLRFLTAELASAIRAEIQFCHEKEDGDYFHLKFYRFAANDFLFFYKLWFIFLLFHYKFFHNSLYFNFVHLIFTRD